MVDAGDSKSPAARCVGSSPTLGTKLKKSSFRAALFAFVGYSESNKELIQGSEPQAVQIVRQGEITPYQFFSAFAIEE